MCPTRAGSPCVSCVHVAPPSLRFIEAAAGTVRGRIDVPRRPARLPKRRVDDVRISRLHRERDRAGVGSFVENLAPGLSAVGRLEDAALGVRAVRMAERSDVGDVGVLRIDDDRADLLRVVQADDASSSSRRRSTCTCRRRTRCRSACRPRRCRRRSCADCSALPRSRRSSRCLRSSKIGFHVRPASRLSQTPPSTAPK